jgi:hypothetical protein
MSMLRRPAKPAARPAPKAEAPAPAVRLTAAAAPAKRVANGHDEDWEEF